MTHLNTPASPAQQSCAASLGSGGDADDAALIAACHVANEAHRAKCTAVEAADLAGDAPGYKAAQRAAARSDAAFNRSIKAVCAIEPRTVAGHAATARLALSIAEVHRPDWKRRSFSMQMLEHVPEQLLATILGRLAGSRLKPNTGGRAATSRPTE